MITVSEGELFTVIMGYLIKKAEDWLSTNYQTVIRGYLNSQINSEFGKIPHMEESQRGKIPYIEEVHRGQKLWKPYLIIFSESLNWIRDINKFLQIILDMKPNEGDLEND